MSLRRRSNLFLLVILYFMILAFGLPGCKEGTSSSPVSALLTDTSKATINLSDLGEDVAKHTMLGSVVSLNTTEKLANITVNLFYENKLAETTKTTSDGQFYFAKLPSGLFDLTFSSSDNSYSPASYVVRILEDGTLSPLNIEVKLSATNPAQVKIQAKIEGEVVLSGSSNKLSNLNIELEDSKGLLISTALSGTSGTFSFDSLNAGTYTLKAGKASTYVETQQTVVIRDDGVVSPKYSVLSLSEKPIENFSIIGYVKTQTKEALTNLEVKIYEDTDLTQPAEQPTRTTGEGKFFFQNLKEAKIFYIKVSAGVNTEASTVYPVRILADGTTSPEIAFGSE